MCVSIYNQGDVTLSQMDLGFSRVRGVFRVDLPKLILELSQITLDTLFLGVDKLDDKQIRRRYLKGN